jgi:hypothetical protein
MKGGELMHSAGSKPVLTATRQSVRAAAPIRHASHPRPASRRSAWPQPIAAARRIIDLAFHPDASLQAWYMDLLLALRGAAIIMLLLAGWILLAH